MFLVHWDNTVQPEMDDWIALQWLRIFQAQPGG